MSNTRIIILLSILLISFTVKAQIIEVNQVGYQINAPKIAAVFNSTNGTKFFITNISGTDTLFSAQLQPARNDVYANNIPVQLADFSAFQQSGTFQLIVPGAINKPQIIIQSLPFNTVGKAVLKGYYYQRASMPLLPQYAGVWARPAGHPDNAVLVHESASTNERPAGSTIATPGGWYDAGDYNKYVVNSGITMYTLLSAYAHYASYFDTLTTNIPETGNGLPDIINELLYNLRWMLTMQDTDGGVYHKCTNAAFDGMVMPNAATQPRYVIEKTTAATLDFAAVMAQAARIFAKWQNNRLPHLADSCKQAAVKAWQWAEQHPNLDYNQTAMNAKFKPAVTTGAYGDTHLMDEWFWAAAELAITTKDKPYINWLMQYKVPVAVIPSWNQVAALGMFSLLNHANELPASLQPLIQNCKLQAIEVANYLLQHGNMAMHTVMGQSNNDFIWGSNAVAANQGMWLLQVFQLAGERRYLNGALSNADYLLGRNATGYCYITGFGTKSPMHPHHRPSIADGIQAPVPGLLVGGPNPARQDGQIYPNNYPETAYTDNDKAYAANEIAINWNAPAVFLLNGLNYWALQKAW